MWDPQLRKHQGHMSQKKYKGLFAKKNNTTCQLLIAHKLRVARVWLVFVKKNPLNWSGYDHVWTKNASSVMGSSVLQVQWIKYTHVTSSVTTNAIYSYLCPA
jgi:hypothetical protein